MFKFDKFTERANLALNYALEEAQSLGPVSYTHLVAKLGKQFYQWAIGKRIIEAKEEYCKIREGLRDSRRKIALARRKSRGRALAESSKIFWTGLWHHKKVFATVFNIVAPVAGIAVLCITIQHWNNMNFALKDVYKRQEIRCRGESKNFEIL